jgi:plasmid stability protein
MCRYVGNTRLLGWDDALYEALNRRAKRNYRTVRAEIRAILAEALREEAEAIRREQEAEQNAKGVSDA